MARTSLEHPPNTPHQLTTRCDRYPGRHRSWIAPICAGVLQASYMRKWMSERLKRRKKPGEGTPKEAAKTPEPLQPRFYDDEPADAAAVVPIVGPAEVPAAPVREARRMSRAEPEVASEPSSVAAEASAAEETRPRTSRRR